uniref:cellulase n=1 Tax=Peruphasma schultei TaxID=614134 RepID=A0A125SKZ6_9NEOP|nr:glycoside hydrolase family 9 [Peruphasma schultei]
MRCIITVAALLLSCAALQAAAATYDYKKLLQMSLLFYEAQRSGKLPSDQKVKWRHDSALNDKGIHGEDLTGGYYDAGDFVKFNFPMAFSTTLLAWSVLDHKKGYEKANALEDGRKAVKWATDYFLKCHVSEFELYGQVGEGTVDHIYWTLPEDMPYKRNAFMITAKAPGSDLAAETAAAMAASYLVFKDVDSKYASTLLTHAKQLMNFAVKYLGKYSDSIADANKFYMSSSYQDELVWGAAWLYRATKDKSYLDIINKYWPVIMYWDGFDWDNKKSGAEVILYMTTRDDKYRERVKSYCDNTFFKTPKTPKGLLLTNAGGNLRSNANAMLVCSEAANLGIEASSYRPLIKQQVGYYVGDTGFSYVVGFGNKYPRYAHHRSSSCPDHPAKCGWDFFNSNTPNHHIVDGALVGGPNASDYYFDTRKDATHNEVTCDNNAGYHGVLVNLIELEG